MNKVILMGRISTDIQEKATTTGKTVVSFNIAVDRPYSKDGARETDFIPCVAWQQTAEFISKFFTKGRRILLEGRIQVRSYEKDGAKRYVTEVIVEKAEFCDSKPSDSSNVSAPANTNANTSANAPAQAQAEPSGGFGNAPVIGDDDIPF